jgi:hypothetical protein
MTKRDWEWYGITVGLAIGMGFCVLVLILTRAP